MRHGVNKIKFKLGKDATRNLVSKLAVNFVVNSKIETTLKKIKTLKPVMERLVEKAKNDSEANSRQLLRILKDKKLVEKMSRDVKDNFKNKVGGYVRIVRLGVSRRDGAETARLEWTAQIGKTKAEAVKPEKLVKQSAK